MKNNFCVIDIETKGLSARPESFVFGCLYSDEMKKVFYSREEMVKFLLSKQNTFKYVFAHNAEFDFTILFDNIIKNFDNSSLFVGSTFVQAKSSNIPLDSDIFNVIKQWNRKIIFSNSLPILKSSVKELGKNLGLQKGETPQEYINWKKGDGEIKVTQKHIEYCFTDCEIVYSFLNTIFDYTGKIKPTIASCAMYIFVNKYLKRPLKFNPLNEKFRESYYGGRVECFRFGKIKPVYKYDIISLYPAACVNMYFPDFGKMKQGRKMDKKYFEKYILKSYEGCAHVTIKHEQNFVGTLPYRKQHEIIYPYGIYTAWYNFNELRAAINTGLVTILNLKEYVFAPRIQFTELRAYMLDFFKLKNEKTGAEKLMYKFFLNALTGKFSQKKYGEKIYFKNIVDAANYKTTLSAGVKVNSIHFGEHREDLFLEVFKKDKPKKIHWNIPTISSYITSQGRIIMLPFYLKYQKNLCYTDTDSLCTNKPIDKKYLSDNILGMFKQENATEMDIKSNKHYSAVENGKKVYRVKGVGYNFKRKGKDFTFDRMIRTKEALRREDMHAGMFVEVVKHLSTNYTKRKVINNVTTTLKLNER